MPLYFACDVWRRQAVRATELPRVPGSEHYFQPRRKNWHALAASDLAWPGSSHVDPRTLAGLLAEVQDPHLQLKVMQLCIAVVETDEHVAEGESAVLAATLTQWGLPQPALQHA